MREFETKNNQEKFTCGELEYQVIRSARKTMTLEVRRDGNVIVRAPLPYRSAEDQKICKPEAGVGSWDVWNGQKNTGNRSR